MRELNLDTEVKFIHAAELEKTASGVIPLRFKAVSLAKFTGMVPIARMGTGIEMQLGGTFKKIEVTARCRFDDGYGLTAEWFWGPHKQLPTVYFLAGNRDVQTFTVEFWRDLSDRYPVRWLFPTHCEIEILKVKVNADAVVKSAFQSYDYRQLPGANRLRYLVHGDSITQGANVSVPTMTWAELTARDLGMDVANLGIGGHGMAELAVAEDLASRQDFDLLSLHIGTNALKDPAYPERLRKYLKIILTAHPDKIVVLVSPILRFDEQEPLLRPTRQAMAEIADTYKKRFPKFFFIPGERLIMHPEVLNADFIHINDQGAMEYAANLSRELRKLLPPQ